MGQQQQNRQLAGMWYPAAQFKHTGTGVNTTIVHPAPDLDELAKIKNEQQRGHNDLGLTRRLA